VIAVISDSVNKSSIKFYATALNIICCCVSLLSANTVDAKENFNTKAQATRLNELNKLHNRGTLRIIVPANLSLDVFPRKMVSPLDEQQKLAMEFAR
jgi:hypothetical protein